MKSATLIDIHEVEPMQALSAESWWQGVLAGIGVIGIVAIAAT